MSLFKRWFGGARERECGQCGRRAESIAPLILELPGGERREAELCFDCVCEAVSSGATIRVGPARDPAGEN